MHAQTGPPDMRSFGVKFPARRRNNENINQTNTRRINEASAKDSHKKSDLKRTKLALGISNALSQRRKANRNAGAAETTTPCLTMSSPSIPHKPASIPTSLTLQDKSYIHHQSPGHEGEDTADKGSSGPMLTDFLEHSPTKEVGFFANDEDSIVHDDELSQDGDECQHVLFIDQDKVMTGKEIVNDPVKNETLDARYQTQLRQLLVYLRTNPECKTKLCDGENELNDVLDLCFAGGSFGIQVLSELIAAEQVCWRKEDVQKAMEFVESYSFEKNFTDPELQGYLLASLKELHPSLI